MKQFNLLHAPPTSGADKREPASSRAAGPGLAAPSVLLQEGDHDRGHIDAVGATSASLLHASDERMAGFNVYEVRDDGTLSQLSNKWFGLDLTQKQGG